MVFFEIEILETSCSMVFESNDTLYLNDLQVLIKNVILKC